MESKCIVCGKSPKRKNYKYCSNKCQIESQYQQYIARWKRGEVDGNRGISARNLSGHLIRYLREKNGEQCSICGWAVKHPISGRVPLEIDHIDGSAENNREENLRMLCPNCHSLTPHFRNKNIGNGRKWRKEKYIHKEVVPK